VIGRLPRLSQHNGKKTIDRHALLETNQTIFPLPDFQIVCIRHNERDVITHFGINGTLYTITDIVNAIKNGDTFYTMKDRRRADVFPKRHHISRELFLTTDPDASANNLDFLDDCPSNYVYYRQFT